MEKPKQDRWRRPGIRLAILGLLILAVYFLAIFVQQSIRVYQLTQERHAQEQVVRRLREENLRLSAIIAENTTEEQILLLVKDHLPLVERGERVVLIYTVPGAIGGPAVVAAAEGPTLEELTALPPWQQWLRVIFYPAAP